MLNELELFKLGKYSVTADKLIIIAVLLSVAFIISRLLRFLVKHYAKRNNKIDGRINSIVQLIIYFIWIIVFILALRTTGLRLAYLLGGSAALLVGLGIGLQDIFRDVVSGIIMLAEGKVRKGDVLIFNDIIGRVNLLGLRTTELIARDGVKLIVPNSKLISENVENLSHSGKPGRHSVKLIVDFNSELNTVTDVLYNCLNELNAASKEQEYKPMVRLVEFATSGYQFELLFWTYEYFKFETIKSDLRLLVSKKFKEKGIRIAFSIPVSIAPAPQN